MKLSLKSFISLLKYVMVIVIIFTVAMVMICLFMPTSMENLVGKVEDELTIDTLTRDKIINMTLEDLYKYIFKPLGNPELTLNEFYENVNKCADKLTELGKTDQLTEEDINSLITTKIIEVSPTDTHKKIGETFDNYVKWSIKHNTEFQEDNRINGRWDALKQKLMNMFTSQKTDYKSVFAQVMQISSMKNQPIMENGIKQNPFTLKTIDQYTGLPTETATTTAQNTTTAATAATAQKTTATAETQKNSILINSCDSIKNQDSCNDSQDVNGKECRWNVRKNTCVVKKR